MLEAITQQQKQVTSRLGVDFCSSNMDSMVGIDKGIQKKIFPVHGLRHPPEGVGTGWFIWSSCHEIPQDQPHFFSPVHARHIYDEYPYIAKYLGLPPGWRFVIDDKGYEDIWYDEALLKI